MPDGLGAVLRLAFLKLRQNVSSSRSNSWVDVMVINSGGGGSLVVADRRAGFLSAFNVFLFSGATLADSKAWRAADSPPILSALVAFPSGRRRPLFLTRADNAWVEALSVSETIQANFLRKISKSAFPIFSSGLVDPTTCEGEEKKFPPSFLLQLITMVPTKHSFLHGYAHGCSECAPPEEKNCFHCARRALEQRAQFALTQILESNTDCTLMYGKFDCRLLLNLFRGPHPFLTNCLCQILHRQNQALALRQMVLGCHPLSLVMGVDLSSDKCIECHDSCGRP